MTAEEILNQKGLLMSYKERLKLEHPECVSNDFIAGCEGCPCDYGYETSDSSLCAGNKEVNLKDLCVLCWNRLDKNMLLRKECIK